MKKMLLQPSLPAVCLTDYLSGALKTVTMLLFLTVALIQGSQAQNQTSIKGRITSEQNQPIAGASVVVKGTKIGVTSNADGFYEISVPAKAVLVFTSVGYASREVAITSSNIVNITLVNVANNLDQVVVVGYGTQRKKDVTGAVVSLSAATLKEVPSSNMIDQLKGRAAGVSIVSNGAVPGAVPQIRIRGNRTLTTSISASDNLDGPLYVVDGIPYGGTLDLNPSDIANMEILKDASATAIYGSRGSGGVILITTKRGRTGKPVMSYDGYYGITSVMGKYNVYNGQEYAQFKRDAATYNRAAPGTTGYPLTSAEAAALAAGVSTDWQDLIYQKGYSESHQLALQGGTEGTQYGLGAGFFRETGIIPNQRYDRFNLRATIDQRISKRIKIGLNTLNTLSYQNTPGGGGVPGGLVSTTPLASPYNTDGKVNLFPRIGSIDAAQVSALTLITKSSSILARSRNLRTFNSLYAEVNILEGLRYRFNAGLNFSQNNFNGYAGPLTYVNGATVQSSSSANVNNTEFWDYNFQNLLYYDKTIKEKHKIGFTGLFEVVKNHSQGSGMSVTGVPADYIRSSNFALASGTPTASGSFTEQGLLSFMGRLNYAYNNRYLLTATLRRDGSSTLAPGHQYFNYPAIGLGWNLSEEAFMKNAGFVSNLKLRGGWGISGNRNVSPYSTLGALSAGYYNFGTGTAGQQLAYTVTNLPALNLGWQSTSQTDIGLEFGFLENRITGSVDWYMQKTKDILLSVNLPPSNGANSTFANLGKTEGKGIEISLSADIIQNKKAGAFNWSADLVYFFNREKITQLSTPQEKSNIGNGWFVGQPLTVIYDYKKVGIWQTEDSAKGLIAAQTSPVQFPGQIRVQDVDGDGKITPKDRQILGNFQPSWEGGITNRFYYKHFDLSVVVYARMGMKMVVPYITGNSTGGGGFGFFNQGRQNQVKTNYWTRSNPTNDFPAPDASNAVAYFASTLGYQDGSFIKCRSINLGYELPQQLIKKTGLTSARIYVNATNPFIIYAPFVKAKFGPDPEGNGYTQTNDGTSSSTVTPTGAGESGTPGRQITANLNNPAVRQFTVGLNLKF